MSSNHNRERSSVRPLRSSDAPEPRGEAPKVHVAREEDLPMGRAAPVPSPSLMFRHSGPPLPGAKREVSPAPTAAPGAEAAPPEPATSTPSTPAQPAVGPTSEEADTHADEGLFDPKAPPEIDPATGLIRRVSNKKLRKQGFSPDEIREIRKEERRLNRVIEGRELAMPGDPVAGAPMSLKDRKAGNTQKDQTVAGDIYVAPVAPMAEMRRRHWGIVLSFLFMVALPLAIAGWYLNTRAVDQFASTAGFTVRSEETGSASLLGGLAATLGGGGSAQTDTDILYEFIQGPSLLVAVTERFDLYEHYSMHWDQDPFYALDPEATQEELLDYWRRIVLVSYDQSSGLMEMRVQAFEAEMAQQISQAILDESQQLINQLNAQARNDKLNYSLEDLEQARTRLREAREALILFRTRTQIVDPLTDLEGRLGVVNSLQQQLAEALIEQDLLRGQTSESDPRYVQVRRKISVIRERIIQERASVASGDATTAEDEAYPELLAEYEGLLADREFAEEVYRVSLAAHDVANSSVARQTRYLASYVRPTLAQTAEYPRRMMTLGLVALFSLLIWFVVVLVYYSVRDSK